MYLLVYEAILVVGMALPSETTRRTCMPTIGRPVLSYAGKQLIRKIVNQSSRCRDECLRFVKWSNSKMIEGD